LIPNSGEFGVRKKEKQRGVCECIFKAKEEEEELWKLKYFTNAKT
jgi:hypothetical protein